MIDVSVVGSLHLDIVVEAPRLPGRDETLIGSSWRYKCGGKGGNQAVAAARIGARTAFGGATGDDDFGSRLRGNLQAAGVDTQHVMVDTKRGSGMSVAIQEASGEYGAVVVSGANGGIDAVAIARAWAPLWVCKVLLLQNEIPEAVNLAVARAAKANSARIVLNAAPARAMPDELLNLADVLIVNRVEAAMLTGFEVETVAQAERAAAALSRGLRDVVVTLGRDGVVVRTGQTGSMHIAAIPVPVVSSHGAGDCFCGALAAKLAEGAALAAACDVANTAAARFVSTPGGKT
jgi:ribokinase